MVHAAHASILPLAIGLTAAALLLPFALRKARPSHRKRSKGIGAFGWALLFLSSGRMPPPPPESQIEQDLNARNTSSSSAGKDHDA